MRWDSIAHCRYSMRSTYPMQFGAISASPFSLSSQSSELILERMPATIELAIASLFIALIVALPLGVISAVKRNSITDHVAMTGATLGIALPTFWIGILLIMVVSINLGWLPAFGRISYEVNLERVTGFHLIDSLLTGNIPAFKDAIVHLILPALVLGIAAATFTTRLVRSSVLGGTQQRLCGDRPK